jgi:hypothetical protein
MNEDDRASVVAPAATRQKIAELEAEQLAALEPPVDRLALRVDAVTSTELD